MGSGPQVSTKVEEQLGEALKKFANVLEDMGWLSDML